MPECLPRWRWLTGSASSLTSAPGACPRLGAGLAVRRNPWWWITDECCEWMARRSNVDSGDEELADPDAAFRAWVNRTSDGQITSTGAVLKKGRDVMKTVQTRYFGRQPDGEPRKRELRFRTHTVRGRTEFDFDDLTADKTSWFCENDEIDRLVGYLTESVDRTGRFRMVEADSPEAQLAELLRSNRLDPAALLAVLVENTDFDKLVSLLVDNPAGLTAARSTVLRDRRMLVARLRALVDDPATTEPAIQRLIGDAYWIFGGRYVGVAERRRLMVLDDTDIPLLCADGSLHIIELKLPGVRDLVTRHRNHWIAGRAVHEAVSQAQNYLRASTSRARHYLTSSAQNSGSLRLQPHLHHGRDRPRQPLPPR